MNKSLALFVVAASMSSQMLTAQINAPDATGYVTRGVAMFNDRNYAGALDQLGKAQSMGDAGMTDAAESEIARLMAIAAVKSGSANGPMLVESWIDRYKGSAKRVDMNLLRGDLALGRGEYTDALATFNAIDPMTLSPELRSDLTYHQAYANLRLANYEEAKRGFERLTDDAEYANGARFYLGYIAYVGRDYGTATRWFDSVNDASELGSIRDFYMAQIYYHKGNYEKALTAARRMLNRRDVEPSFVAEANRIIGESMYQTGDPTGAILYLRKYVSMTENPEVSALYVLGVSEYEDGDFEAAVKSLTPVTADNSAMGQSAYLYIGQALLKTGDDSAAIMAFNRALTMDIDPAVTETAYYNYAVANTRGANVPFASSVTIFENFLSRYPNSRYADQVSQYIVDGYITDDNYEAALASINRMKKPNDKILAAKQLVTYTIGARQLGADRAEAALPYLQQAHSLGKYDSRLALETKLALGEARLRTGDADGAVPYLLEYLAASSAATPNRAVAQYDLGYARMAQKDWNNAGTDFERVIAAPDGLTDATVADAWTRLGDTRYYRRQWSSAAEAYDKAYGLNPATGDYPLFQKAIVQGYARQYGAKLSTLDNMVSQFPSSSLVPDALLEMAEVNTQLNNSEQTAEIYRRLIDEYGATRQGRLAALYLASDRATRGNPAEAITIYQNLIASAPTSEEAQLANEAVKRLHADRGTLDDYTEFLSTVNNAPTMDAQETETLEWNAAERAYVDGHGTGQLERYVAGHEHGRYTAQALSYLLENAELTDNPADAYKYASQLVADWPDNAVTEDALAVKAAADYSQGRGMDALELWEKLETKASTPESKNTARMGIMRVARDLGDADKLMAAAEAVLASTAAGSEDKTEAEFSRGLAYDLNGDTEQAFEIWKPLSKLTDDLYGAKAAVYGAQNRLDAGKTKDAMTMAENFIGSGTPHTYWLGRGFIVLSDALEASGRHFEAVEYIKALKDNYPGDETDIYEMIEERLK